MKVKSLIVLPLMLLHFDPHYRAGIQMLVLYKQINPGKAAAQQLHILLYPAPTGQDARGGDPNASSLQKKFRLAFNGKDKKDVVGHKRQNNR